MDVGEKSKNVRTTKGKNIMRKVTEIPATIAKYTAAPLDSKKKRRVAGYARVSTDNEEQATSYEAQVDYYTNYIKGHEEWEFAGMYTDEGISGTNTKHREGFKRMVGDALDGKIDLIVTKSVSRFARNTVDSLTTVRQLRERGIEVYFEKENIWTLDAKGELLITIMSSLAQEESRSISENITWGQRKRFADGKVSVPYSHFLGYDRGPDGGLVVNEEQAKTVRKIYELFLGGLSCYAIAKRLTQEGLPTPAGKEKWSPETVRRILENEKYKGDALLQKKFTIDFLQHKMKKNEGEIPQYYVEGCHEAIIPPRTFDYVQEELERRSKGEYRYSGVSIFSSKIKCGACGGWYGAKVWHSTDKYRKVVYRCNMKYGKGKKCDSPHVTEEQIKAVFVKAVNRMLRNKDELITNAQIIIETLCDGGRLEDEKKRLRRELSDAVALMDSYIKENARHAMNQDEYEQRYREMMERYEKLKGELDGVLKAIENNEKRKSQMELFVCTLKVQEPIKKFNERLWASIVDYVTVFSTEDIRVTFKDGTAVKG